MSHRWTEQELMAYVDGELDATQRAAFERALADDEPLRARVAALRAQRDRVAAAYASVLDEPVPPRLSAALEAAAPRAGERGQVIDLGAARAARTPREWPGWARWGGMAAAVLVGVLLGTQLPRDDAQAEIALHDGRVADGSALERALSTQLAGDAAGNAPLAVQLSFVDRSGTYCRSFSSATLAGLACRRDGHWAVQTLAALDAAPAGGTMRPAASALPPAVLQAIDARIAGDALDAAREREARDRGWRR